MSVRDLMRQHVYTMLDTDLTAVYGSALPLERENHKFSTPLNAPHIICWFRYANSRKAAVGTVQSFIRHSGHFMVDVVVPDDTGTSVMWQIVDALATVFKEQSFKLLDNSDVTLSTPKVSGNARPQDGYYFLTVMVPFRIDAKSQ